MCAVHTHVVSKVILNEGYAGISITCEWVCCAVRECLLADFRKNKLNIEIFKMLDINFTCCCKLKTGEGIICKIRHKLRWNRFVYLKF